jgi:hypothetical protein
MVVNFVVDLHNILEIERMALLQCTRNTKVKCPLDCQLLLLLYLIMTYMSLTW